MRIFLKLSLVFAVLLSGVSSVYAEEEGIPYTRIASSADGESYFEDGVLPYSYMELPSGEHAGLHELDTESSTYMMFPSGVFEDFHPTPNSQMLVVIQGEVEVGVSSGELRRFTSGMVVMMHDNAGKGHTTRTLGEQSHIALMIRQPE